MCKALRTYLDESEEPQKEFGDRFGVSQAAVSKWLKHGVPPKRVFQVSKVTGIPPEKLCPELFRGTAA